uniref:Uncharacterized protein n=1 Tax=Physcomitrium patens TaxID=3218 RepID=A0A2K1KC22_PHYPA|nr:hypothetical protein PHYPA_010522 [Physcomitrium patens]
MSFILKIVSSMGNELVHRETCVLQAHFRASHVHLHPHCCRLPDGQIQEFLVEEYLSDDRVRQHPEHVQNLYFTNLFVLRALLKTEKYVSEAGYFTGNDAEDHLTHKLMIGLVGSERLRIACPIPFNEATMWGRPDAYDLKPQLQKNFRNITALMDCVGCK